MKYRRMVLYVLRMICRGLDIYLLDIERAILSVEQ